ncbi:MAG: LysR family transcriptional regulator [Alphaproteobacteria bacterium]|nr:LysR family transcriptional regulator [Alphaproteobacteria bacterium]
MERPFLPSLRQVRTFAAVARFESISRASAQLHLSQSAASQAIATLEAKLEVPLFVRRGKGTYLSEYGRIFEKRTLRFFEALEGAVHELAHEAGPVDRTSATAASHRITNAQLRALIAIYEAGSFTQAARRLGISLASVQRSARSLEAELRQKIFHNTAVGVTTNERGARFAERLLRATRELEGGIEEVNAKRGAIRGRILVGALMMAGNYLLASTLSKFISVYKAANITVINGPYDVLLGKLRAGSLDFLVGLLKNPAPADDVIEEELAPDPYKIAVRVGHRLSNKREITRGDLVGLDWILAPSLACASRRMAFENTFHGLGRPHTDVEIHSLPAIASILAHGDRAAILTQSELEVACQQGKRLKALNFGPIEPSSAIGVTTRKDWHPTYLQRMFLEFLRGQTIRQPVMKRISSPIWSPPSAVPVRRKRSA